MKEEETYSNEERLLDALESPEKLTPEEWEELLADPQTARDLRLIGALREVFIRQHAELQPDTRREWAHFRQRQESRKRRRRALWTGVGIGVAASVLLFFGWQWNRPQETVETPREVMVFAADEGKREVTLSTEKGQTWSVAAAATDTTFQETGIAVKEGKLDYAQVKAAPETHTLSTPRCTDYYFVLEDGTEVWLNAESNLRYPNRFEGGRREVELQGEGFFKVARDTARPFVVKAGGLVTEVLGTEFNVRTYKREDSHVTLLKGSVRVKEEGQAEGVIIQPGEDARWRGDGTFEVKEVDTDNYYLWTEGYFYFDNEPLVEIARELGRWYNADVVFNNPDAMAYRLHFLAEREQSVEEVLGLLNLMGKVKATFSNNKIVIE